MATIQGKSFKNSSDFVVFERGKDQLIFKIKTVRDYSYFDQLVPMPKVKKVLKPDGSTEEATREPDFVKAMEARSTNRFLYMYIKSIEDTDGLVWDKIDMSKPETYAFIDEELSELGLSPFEILKLQEKILALNGLSEKAIEEATDRFLASQLQKEEQLSQKVAQ